MVISTAREAGACFSVVDFMSYITAIIANGGRAFAAIYREAVEIN